MRRRSWRTSAWWSPTNDHRFVEHVHMVLNRILIGYFLERLQQKEEPASA